DERRHGPQVRHRRVQGHRDPHREARGVGRAARLTRLTRAGPGLTDTLAPMDLHVIAPLPSPAERAAVDRLLDPLIGPPTTWTGGARAIGVDGHAARGGHAARSRRDLLLPALHAVQSRVGWISQPA